MSEQTFRAGAARVEITPDRPQYLDGYGNRTTPSEGVYLPIQARALYLAGGGGEGLVISAEVLAFDFEQAARIRARIAAGAGVPAAAVVLAATHTHCAPRVCDMLMPGEVDPEYVAWFEERLVIAAREARAAAAPARAGFSTASGGLGVNRRVVRDGRAIMRPNPTAANDSTISTLWVETQAGPSTASLSVYACHPTCRGGPLIGGDYPGYLSQNLEAERTGTALFALGCAGDIRPRFTNPEGRFRSAEPEEVAAAGKELAGRVLAGRAGAIPLPVERVEVRRAVIDLPFSRLPSEDELAAVAAGDPNPLKQAWGKRMLDQFPGGVPSAAPFEIQVLALPPSAAWVFLAGEMVVDYALALARYRPPLVVAAGYANGSVGYVPSRRIYPEGGYEVDGSYFYYGQPAPFREEVEDLILGRAREMLA